MEVMVVNGMFLISFRTKILGKSCDRQRFFDLAFLCQIVVKSLRKTFWQCPCSFALRVGKHMQVAHGWTGVEFVWVSITRWDVSSVS